MNVGELRALLEFVDDETEVYKAITYNEKFSKLVDPDIRLAFVETAESGAKFVASEDASVGEEIGLVIG